MAVEISRQGANRKSGWVTIKTKKPVAVSMDSDSKAGPVITLSLKKTSDPDRSGEYDHEVRLTLSDIAAVVDTLAGLGISKYSEDLSRQLSSSVRSLHRLTAAASGIPVIPDTKKLELNEF
ncbi:hypothetical protein D3C77_202650 [compost metagenome]